MAALPSQRRIIMRVLRHALSLGLALGLSLSFACTDTPPDPVVEPAFSKAPPQSGVVKRFTVVNGFIVVDPDNGLRATIGFDRARFCADRAAETFTTLRDYLAEHEVQRTFHADGRTTAVRRLEGILVVSDGPIFQCSSPVIGLGTGRMELTKVRLPGPNSEQPPDVAKTSFSGFITTADGSTKRVNVLDTRWEGFRNDEFFDVIIAKIVLR